MARALGAGVPVLCCPAVGDMAENGARVAWAGAGLTVPWRLRRRARCGGPCAGSWREPRFAERAGEIAAWSAANDGAEHGAQLVEKLRA